MTWEEILKLEPRLAKVEKAIRDVDVNDPDFYFWDFWEDDCKAVFYDMVGWGAEHKLLRNRDAWDVVYDRFHELLLERTKGPKPEQKPFEPVWR